MKKQTTEEVINDLKILHPNLDFSKFEYNGNLVPAVIICNKHGEFEKAPKGLKKGEGCKMCSREELGTKLSLSSEEYLKRCLDKHGDKYDYSKINYVNSGTKILVGCPKHGEFSILPTHFNSEKGEGCPKCSKEIVAKSLALSTEQFVTRAIEIHGERYDYSKTEYINGNTKLTVNCKIHGNFEVLPFNHLNGVDCAECVGNALKTTDQFIEESVSIHGNKYNYDSVVYKGKEIPVTIFCKECECSFDQKPRNHVTSKAGCPTCAGTKKLTTEEFIVNAEKVHGIRYDYSKVNYSHNRAKVEIICKVHGSFFQQPIDHVYDKNGCPSCSHIISRGQLEVEEFIKTLGIAIQRNYKLKNGSEIDIYIPHLQIGIEYNGLFWHSEDKRGAAYHLNKLQTCDSEKIRLIQIFEDEWVTKSEIVKAKLRAILGKSTQKLFARKTKIVTVPPDVSREFLNNTHIQGAGFTTTLNFGLLNENNTLVALMTFGKLRFEKGLDTEYELIRFSSSTHVVGGFSKLLKHFMSTNPVTKIVSYSDKRWSVGNVYEGNGFAWASRSNPGYFWCKNGIRHNRILFQKHKLKTKLKTFDETLSESENCVANGYYKIFDCGMDKWELSVV